MENDRSWKWLVVSKTGDIGDIFSAQERHLAGQTRSVMIQNVVLLADTPKETDPHITSVPICRIKNVD